MDHIQAPGSVTIIAEAGPDEDPRRHWTQELQDEFERDNALGMVGSVLVSETEDVRVWHLHLAPGERCNFHRHVLNYFWTAMTPGVARGYYEDGRIEDAAYYRGQTKHFIYRKDERMIHSLENVGDTELVFTTVEFLNSENSPLPVPDHVRLKAPT